MADRKNGGEADRKLERHRSTDNRTETFQKTDKPADRQQKADALAGEIIRLAQSTLVMEMRFFDVAAFRLKPVPRPGITVAANGRMLYYDSWYILTEYRRDPGRMNRMFLHTLLHCLLGHLYTDRQVQQPLWDLASDIAAEALINSLSVPAFETEAESREMPLIERLQAELPFLTAERIYLFLQKRDLRSDEIFDLQQLFRMDDHGLWYEPVKKEKKEREEAGSEGDSERNNPILPDPGTTDTGSQSGSPESGTRGTGSRSGRTDSDGDSGILPESGRRQPQERMSEAARKRRFVNERENRQDWEKISRRMQVELETHLQQQGTQAGNLLQDLQDLHRERYDYREFLRKFTTIREIPGVNDEEFDYGLYTYGMELYGDTPLVEPLESRRERGIRDFVIAIDTSGSVSGDMVQAFLQKTYDILKTDGSFFEIMNLYLLQCDSRVQEAAHITTQKDLDRYLSGLKIRGFGGTDFRPVFAFIEEKRKSGELKELQGLLYFTDGYGTFPGEKPAYDTAFVFLRDGGAEPEVPPWAMKVVLEKEDLFKETLIK